MLAEVPAVMFVDCAVKSAYPPLAFEVLLMLPMLTDAIHSFAELPEGVQYSNGPSKVVAETMFEASLFPKPQTALTLTS